MVRTIFVNKDNIVDIYETIIDSRRIKKIQKQII